MSLPRKWGFCDLCVSDKFDFSKIEEFEKLGYHTIAVNTHYIVKEEPEVEIKEVVPRAKRVKKEFKDFPPPMVVDKRGTNLNILNRITLEFSNANIAQRFSRSATLQKYDILAMMPDNLNVLQFVLSNTSLLDFDIIAIKPDVATPYKIGRKLYNLVVDKRICFELPYGPMINSSVCRQNLISMGHTYHSSGWLQNVIMTSYSEHIDQVRDVYDVINLGFLFGLNERQSLAAVYDLPNNLIVKALSRNSRKMYVAIVGKADEDDASEELIAERDEATTCT